MSVKVKTVKASPAADAPKELTVVSKVIKGDTYMVIADAAREMDDEFIGLELYKAEGSAMAVAPPYQPKTLKNLVSHNNVLNQCIHAMEVNIDGTGHEFVQIDEDTEIDETELQLAESFFAEPYPGKSFMGMRRDARRDVESMGYGFLEVLRNLVDEVVATRYIEAQSIRLVKLGAQMPVTHRVMRGGKEVDFKVQERPRRFIQVINGSTVQYFKEFGCPLELHRKTGAWQPEGQTLPAEDRATEVLYYGGDKDVATPYFVPKWINQMPSVIGSRKAEEQNLEFFDSGGMPPAIIFIQGGAMVGDTAEQLRTYLSGQNRRKGRAIVAELSSNSGSIDSGGNVSVKVERFGAERANDSMYSKYDKTAEDHVRVGFRLPPLFLGQAVDYNYATAVVAYQVAEAQVFGPERSEFDELINKTIIKALGLKTLKFKSLPITLKSVEETFKGLQLLDGKVDEEAFVKEVNKQIGTDIAHDPLAVTDEDKADLETARAARARGEKIGPVPTAPAGGTSEPEPGLPNPGAKPAPGKEPQPPGRLQAVKRLQVFKLVRKAAVAEGFVEGEMEDQERARVRQEVSDLQGEDVQVFNETMGVYLQPARHEH